MAVHGRVVSTDPLAVRLVADGTARDLRVVGADTSVVEGDVLEVYGRLESPDAVVARETVRKPAGAYLRTRVLSLVAGLGVLALGWRYWRVDWRRGALVRRTTSSTEGPDG